MRHPVRKWFALVGLGFGLAGASKVLAFRPQRLLFRSWGWPDDVMLIVGGLELGGAVLMTGRRTRHLGAATVAATSVAVLSAEIEHGQNSLTPGRLLMLLAAATAMV
jgi:uncharacterized membrane protein YphA (DoxX/SURF4 family)